MRLLSLLVVSVLVFGSCVTNKKYQMMQKNDVNKQNMPSDSVFRKYLIEPFDYKIQTNDILSVRFESLTPKEFDFLSKGNDATMGNAVLVGGALLVGDIVDENGEIPYPVVGKVKVIGLTIFEAQEYLQTLASKYLEGPIVKVRLLNYRITVLGELNREGVVLINNNRVSILEAIGLAGGLTDLADKSSIKLIRQKGNSSEVVYLNLLDENFINSPYYYVYQNDVLIVPALRQRPFRKYFGQNISLIISSISLLLLVVSYTK
jgi:polysaccharide biosynthesis/export protein